MGHEDCHGPPTRKRRMTGEALVEDTRERVDVRTPGHNVAGDLFGGRVRDRAREMCRLALRAGWIGASRQAEVGEVAVFSARLLDDEDVRRLHVTVDEPTGVGGVQRGRDLAHESERPFGVERRVTREERAQVRALHVTHGDIEMAVRLPRVVDRYDVGVIETGGKLRFTEEARAEALVLRLLGRDQLERDRSSEPRVERPVDDAHAAAPEDRFDLVAGKLIARLKFPASDGRCQSVSVGRRIGEGNLP